MWFLENHYLIVKSQEYILAYTRKERSSDKYHTIVFSTLEYGLTYTLDLQTVTPTLCLDWSGGTWMNHRELKGERRQWNALDLLWSICRSMSAVCATVSSTWITEVCTTNLCDRFYVRVQSKMWELCVGDKLKSYYASFVLNFVSSSARGFRYPSRLYIGPSTNFLRLFHVLWVTWFSFPWHTCNTYSS